MLKKARWKTRLALFLKGIAMGTADVIPGVSGGTIAFITGIYETLIQSLGDIGFSHLQAVLKLGGSKRQRHEAIHTLAQVNWGFFLPLFSGIIIAILTLSKIIPLFMENYPVQTYAFFFGLILISAKFPFDEMDKSFANFAVLILSTLLAFLFFSFQGQVSGSLHPFYIFISGAIAVCALILPGISGSYILVLLGMYKLILQSVHDRDLLVVGIFIGGMVVGVFSFIHILKWLLDHWRSFTMSALTGILLGSLKVIWPLNYLKPGENPSSHIFGITLAIIVGIVVVLLLSSLSKQSQQRSLSS